MSNNTAMTLLRNLYQSGHGWLEGTVQGVTAEVAHWQPPGRSLPIAAEYAHVVFSEDALFAQMLANKPPMFMSTPSGASEPPPPGNWNDWGRRVQLDLDVAHAYAQQVYAATDAYLAACNDDVLGQPCDLSSIGMEMQTKAVLIGLLLQNIHNHAGEISCLKGLQGLQGYPA